LFIEKREYCVVGEWKGKEIVEWWWYVFTVYTDQEKLSKNLSLSKQVDHSLTSNHI
jgi:hypothetical protein